MSREDKLLPKLPGCYAAASAFGACASNLAFSFALVDVKHVAPFVSLNLLYVTLALLALLI